MSDDKIPKVEITRKIMHNGAMKRLNIPRKIFNKGKELSKLKCELGFDFEKDEVTWIFKG